MHPFSISRRRLLQSFGLGALTPNLALANSTVKKRVLLIFCYGGWDPTYFFTTGLDHTLIDGDPSGSDSIAGNIPFVDNASRPNIRNWMNQWSEHLCILNGLSLQSISHEVCMEQAITGSLHSPHPDWLSSLANQIGQEAIMPLLHISGPSFAKQLNHQVVRMGDNRQLLRLLDGTALNDISSVSRDWDVYADLEDAFVENQLRGWVDAPQRLWAANHEIEERRRKLQQLESNLSLGETTSFHSKLMLATESLITGSSQCAMLQHNGWNDYGWDTHGGNGQQSQHFEDLFGGLQLMMEQLSTRSTPSGNLALEETLVVVMSEMGRFPKLNSRSGKEHWPYTSAMLIGAGIQGGQVIQGFDEGLQSAPINHRTGVADSTGTVMTMSNLTSTIFEACGVDSSIILPEHQPIFAALNGV